jgi:sirohydrochlorin ferrochelatase
MPRVRIILAAVLTILAAGGTARAQSRGVLLLAHGGSEQWNAHVTKLAADVDRTMPTEVAFGMATRANIQGAVDRLRARGITEIVAVPLFVSSWSSVITSTEYLLGQRDQAPPELEIFAKMDHSGSKPAGGHDSASHGGADHGSHA